MRFPLIGANQTCDTLMKCTVWPLRSLYIGLHAKVKDGMTCRLGSQCSSLKLIISVPYLRLLILAAVIKMCVCGE